MIKLASSTVLAALSLGASAATVTSPAGVTLNVTSACTVTGNVLNLGTFNLGETAAAYRVRQGAQTASGVFTAGSDAPGLLATVNCPATIGWKLRLIGAASGGDIQVKDPAAANAFTVMGRAADIGGTTAAAWLNTAYGLNGVGTGAAQTINGFFPHDLFAFPGESAYRFANGTYTAAATATLDF